MLSVEESARVLGISASRVRKLIADGVLPAKKIGRAWVVPEEAVMNRLAAKPHGGRPRTSARALTNSTSSAPSAEARANELSQLYRECKRAFATRPEISIVQAATTREEAAFYMTVADFFLQQKQAELVKAGAF